MTLFAFLLVLISAILHATWNLVAKRVEGGIAFLWLFSMVSVVCFSPIAIGILVIQRPEMSVKHLLFMSGSSLCHFVYFSLLTYGYKAGDLSIVYPVSRSSGPLLTIVVAVLLLGETLSVWVIFGSGLVIGGMLILTGDPRQLWSTSSRKGLIWGLLIGLSIAGYSVWDKIAVSSVMVPPLLLDSFNNISRSLTLTPYARRHWPEVHSYWQQFRREAIIIGVMGTLSYLALLTALVFSPLSLISPTRQISILFGTWMGTKLLSESHAQRRLLASGVMVVGVIMLAIGG